jgi:hypothetical protein
VKILVEEDKITPVRVFLKLLRAAVDRTSAVLGFQENVRQPLRDLLG